jgi:trimeric autotransporter adhesin
VYALAVHGNQLYVGGLFSSAGGQPVRNVARWDGTNWFPVGTNAPTVFSISVRNTNEIYIGHGSAATEVGPYVGRWNGSNWVSLGGGVTLTSATESAPVRSVLVRGSDVFVGGMFTRVGGVTATNLARWDGAQWQAVGGGLDYFFPNAIKTHVVVSMISVGSELYVCGNFNKVGGQNITNLARWNGASWFAVGSNYWGALNAVAVGSSGVYIGGDIDPYIDGVTKGVVKWDNFGWSGLGSGVNGSVNALAAMGSELYVGGRFGLAGVRASTNFALWHDAPSLRIERIMQGVRLSWPTQYSGTTLQFSSNVAPANWFTVPGSPGMYSGRYALTNAVSGKATFFRLQRP